MTITKDDAEEFTQALGQIVAGSWRQIALAKRLGVPKALGLDVEQWVNERLGGYVRLSIPERREAVKELAAEGHSEREIAEVIGASDTTVHRDLTASNEANRADNEPIFASNEAPVNMVATLAADEKLRAQAVTEQKLQERRERNDELREQALAIEPPSGKYRCIVIDPPWEIEPYERTVRPNQPRALDYPTMGYDELVDYPVRDMIADDGTHLFCWTTQKYLPVALQLIRQWGFDYCLTMVWHKPGGPQPWGLPQYNCEFIVYARAGSPQFVDTKQFFACFNAPRREHSRKPDEFYDVVKRVTSEPRRDLFSREPRDGFDGHGVESRKFAV